MPPVPVPGTVKSPESTTIGGSGKVVKSVPESRLRPASANAARPPNGWTEKSASGPAPAGGGGSSPRGGRGSTVGGVGVTSTTGSTPVPVPGPVAGSGSVPVVAPVPVPGSTTGSGVVPVPASVPPPLGAVSIGGVGWGIVATSVPGSPVPKKVRPTITRAPMPKPVPTSARARLAPLGADSSSPLSSKSSSGSSSPAYAASGASASAASSTIASATGSFPNSRSISSAGAGAPSRSSHPGPPPASVPRSTWTAGPGSISSSRPRKSAPCPTNSGSASRTSPGVAWRAPSAGRLPSASSRASGAAESAKAASALDAAGAGCSGAALDATGSSAAAWTSEGSIRSPPIASTAAAGDLGGRLRRFGRGGLRGLELCGGRIDEGVEVGVRRQSLRSDVDRRRLDHVRINVLAAPGERAGGERSGGLIVPDREVDELRRLLGDRGLLGVFRRGGARSRTRSARRGRPAAERAAVLGRGSARRRRGRRSSLRLDSMRAPDAGAPSLTRVGTAMSVGREGHPGSRIGSRGGRTSARRRPTGFSGSEMGVEGPRRARMDTGRGPRAAADCRPSCGVLPTGDVGLSPSSSRVRPAARGMNDSAKRKPAGGVGRASGADLSPPRTSARPSASLSSMGAAHHRRIPGRGLSARRSCPESGAGPKPRRTTGLPLGQARRTV